MQKSQSNYKNYSAVESTLGASLVIVLANIRLEWKKLAWDKDSSLFWPMASTRLQSKLQRLTPFSLVREY